MKKRLLIGILVSPLSAFFAGVTWHAVGLEFVKHSAGAGVSFWYLVSVFSLLLVGIAYVAVILIGVPTYLVLYKTTVPRLWHFILTAAVVTTIVFIGSDPISLSFIGLFGWSSLLVSTTFGLIVSRP